MFVSFTLQEYTNVEKIQLYQSNHPMAQVRIAVAKVLNRIGIRGLVVNLAPNMFGNLVSDIIRQ